MARLIRGAATACAAAAVTCGPSHAPDPPPVTVSQVTIPTDQVHPAPSVRQHFDCQLEAPPPDTRISFELVQLARDGNTLGETRAVYQIQPALADDYRISTARVTLVSFVTTNSDRAASAWSIALDAGWIQPRLPFEIQRRGASWCFVKKCEDTQRREVATAIGDTADLLALPELARELQRPSGESSIELPRQLLRRLGLGEHEPASIASRARRFGNGFPARFVLDGQDASEAADGSPMSAELEVTRSCRLSFLRIQLAANQAEYERDARIRYRFTWRFDPMKRGD